MERAVDGEAGRGRCARLCGPQMELGLLPIMQGCKTVQPLGKAAWQLPHDPEIGLQVFTPVKPW